MYPNKRLYAVTLLNHPLSVVSDSKAQWRSQGAESWRYSIEESGIKGKRAKKNSLAWFVFSPWRRHDFVPGGARK